MELLSLCLVALCSILFGFFLGYERKGGHWTLYATIISFLILAGVNALTGSEEMTVARQFSYNVTVFSSFVLGFTYGLPFKRPWWKKTVLVTILTTISMLVYTAFIV